MMRSLLLSFFIVGIAMTAFAQDIDRTVRPKAQGVPKVDLPDIQKTTLKNGLRVWLVEAHELPLVAFNLVVQNGSDTDPVAKSGLATLTADALDEGTKTRTSLQIAEELDFIGANLGVNAFTDGSFVTLNCMTKHLDKALAVYSDVIVNPTFPRKDVDRLQQQRLTSLLQQKDRAATIASLSFNKVIYGDSHPYGQNASGNEKSVKEITRDDLVKFYETYYRPGNATLIIVGNATMTTISSKLEKLFAGWTDGKVPPTLLPQTPTIDRRRLYVIDKPGAPQSEVRIGYPAAARNTPDFFALQLANRVLGGQFSSRLNMNLREKHGFTYGARSGFTFNKQAGPFVASAGVTAAKTDSSMREFLYEIDRLCNDGVTAEELEFVKKGFTGNFALTFETPAQIAGALQNLVLYNLPDNYYETYLHNVNNVTLEDVQHVSKKYFDSSKMGVVIVGDLKVIRDGLEKMKIGETVMLDVNGNKVQ